MKKSVRATKSQKAIIDAHLAAKQGESFKCRPIKSTGDLLEALKAGETCQALLEEIEYRECSVTSILTSNIFDHMSENYKRDVRRGFINFLNHYNIK